MTSFEEIKKALTEAANAESEPRSIYHESARIIVNIERQSFYGNEPSHQRLKKIRDHFSQAVKEVNKE